MLQNRSYIFFRRIAYLFTMTLPNEPAGPLVQADKEPILIRSGSICILIYNGINHLTAYQLAYRRNCHCVSWRGAKEILPSQEITLSPFHFLCCGVQRRFPRGHVWPVEAPGRRGRRIRHLCSLAIYGFPASDLVRRSCSQTFLLRLGLCHG